MTATCEEIILGGFKMSAAAIPDSLVSVEGEMVDLVGRLLTRAMVFGRQVNPAFFGSSALVPRSTAGSLTGWARPADCAALLRVDAAADTQTAAPAAIAQGTEIKVVPFTDRGVGAGDPSVYEFAQMLLPAGNAGDPATGGLTLLYCRNAVLPTALASPIDALFPAGFYGLLEVGVAKWLADKDGRDADSQRFAAAEDDWYGAFDSFLRDASPGTLQRYRQFRHVPRTAARAEEPA